MVQMFCQCFQLNRTSTGFHTRADSKRCHGFINTPRLYLGVSAVLLYIAAREQVRLGPARLGHLMLSDGFFGQIFHISLSSSLAISSAVILANKSGGMFPHSTFFP